MGEPAMNEELQKAEMLRGYRFFHHPDMPTVGILRLDTENDHHFVMVTKQGLRHLSDACLKHAEDLAETQ